MHCMSHTELVLDFELVPDTLRAFRSHSQCAVYKYAVPHWGTVLSAPGTVLSALYPRGSYGM